MNRFLINLIHFDFFLQRPIFLSIGLIFLEIFIIIIKKVTV